MSRHLRLNTVFLAGYATRIESCNSLSRNRLALVGGLDQSQVTIELILAVQWGNIAVFMPSPPDVWRASCMAQDKERDLERKMK